MTLDQRVAVGLSIVAPAQKMFFDILKAQIVDWRLAEGLLARRAPGGTRCAPAGTSRLRGEGIVADVRYSRPVPHGLADAYMFGFRVGWRASWASVSVSLLISGRWRGT